MHWLAPQTPCELEFSFLDRGFFCFLFSFLVLSSATTEKGRGKRRERPFIEPLLHTKPCPRPALPTLAHVILTAVSWPHRVDLIMLLLMGN